jgi:hypothetical protein
MSQLPTNVSDRLSDGSGLPRSLFSQMNYISNRLSNKNKYYAVGPLSNTDLALKDIQPWLVCHSSGR